MRWMPRYVLAGLSLFVQSCLLDVAPAREPLDRMWMERMLAAEYGSWINGVSAPAVGGDEIQSSPGGAVTTRHGIEIQADSTLGTGGWYFMGGVVGRVSVRGADLELFGKEVFRVHGPKGTGNLQDRSYEFFLVARPTEPGAARVVRQWHFSWEELAPTVAPEVTERLRREYAAAELERRLERNQIISLDGYLAVDPNSKTATVTINGLKRPFREQIDLSRELS